MMRGGCVRVDDSSIWRLIPTESASMIARLWSVLALCRSVPSSVVFSPALRACVMVCCMQKTFTLASMAFLSAAARSTTPPVHDLLCTTSSVWLWHVCAHVGHGIDGRVERRVASPTGWASPGTVDSPMSVLVNAESGSGGDIGSVDGGNDIGKGRGGRRGSGDNRHNNLVPQQNTRPDLGDRAPNVSQHRPGGLIVVPVYN